MNHSFDSAASFLYRLTEKLNIYNNFKDFFCAEAVIRDNLLNLLYKIIFWGEGGNINTVLNFKTFSLLNIHSVKYRTKFTL